MTYQLSPQETIIADMLSYRRPHDSPGEKAFVDRYIRVLPDIEVLCDDIGTEQVYMLDISRPDGKRNRTAFCAHVDSVHNRSIPDARQPVGFDPTIKTFMTNNPDYPHDCLGADDAAGIYVLLRMIEAKVPGKYLFFRGEERGGISSSWLAAKRADILDRITSAIQFDRRGTTSIITTMACGETCSPAFADALAEALSLGHEQDPTGSFTDTALLADIVPECTNVSVGYEREHSTHETLDAEYLIRLAEACIAAFSDPDLDLPCQRLPGDYGTPAASLYSMSGYSSAQQDDWLDIRSAFDLPYYSRDELVEIASYLTNEQIANLLYEAGQLIDRQESNYYSTRNH